MPKAKATVVFSATLLGAIQEVWQEIGSDTMMCAQECGEEVSNEEAIESCIDADRLTTIAQSPESDAEVSLLIKQHTYTGMMKQLRKELQLA